MADQTTATLIVMANSRNNRPTMPVINSSGMKTAISDTLSEMTVNPICFAPLSAASNGGSPISINRTMFSIITMASSTTKPVEIVSAISDRLSSVNPQSFITPNVPIIANGNATLGITVAQNFRRKIKITSTTKPIVSINVNCTSCTDARIVCVRSVKTLIFTDGGMEERKRGSNAFTRSAVSMILAPG